jgi:poly(3-hydroxybutyrate) depolymerase
LSRDGQTGWLDFGSGSVNGIAQVDIDFFDALVTHLKTNYCIDTSRVFSMGHSAGGFISNQLACVRSNVLRGIGPVAGGGPEGNCGGKVAAIVLHNPKEGDPTECAKMSGGSCPWVVLWSDSGWPTVQYWTSKNNCSAIGGMPTTAFAGNSTTGNPLPCKAYTGCDANYPVTLCLYDYSDQWDGPHAFPVQWGGKAITDFFLGLPKP